MGDIRSNEDFGAFYEHTYAMSFRLAWAITRDSAAAADATHDAYVEAFRHRGDLRDLGRADAWIRRIVARAAIDRATSRQRSPVAALDAAEAMPAHRESLPDPDLADALGRLAPRARAGIVLRYYLGHSYEEIAAMLDLKPGSVSTLLSRALDALRADLDGPPRAARIGRGELDVRP